MSKLTQCNYCSLGAIKRRARLEGKKVVLRPGWGGGTDVLVVPKLMEIPSGMLGDESLIRKKYLASWMMEIGERCEC